MQETAPGEPGRWDVPSRLDPDGSGELADDLDTLGGRADRSAARAHTSELPSLKVTFYGAAAADEERLYLLYVLYYPADWSTAGGSWRLDHAGDVEGTLLVVSRREARVEAVVTQAHRRFYLWMPEQPDGEPARQPRSVSGTFATSPDGRPLLFAESGGHGLYAYGSGRWHPPGGNRYDAGTSAVPPDRLVRLEAGEIRPLEEMRRFVDPTGTRFRGLGRGATPPWTWNDVRGGRRGAPGAIVLDPAGFCRELLRSRRP